jgi:hypothetical protein
MCCQESDFPSSASLTTNGVAVASGALLNVGRKHFNKVVYSHFGSQADRSLFDLGNFNPVANFV